MSQEIEIIESLEKGEQVAAVYLDITKAFEIVNHDILVNKLENCRFRGGILYNGSLHTKKIDFRL